MPKKVKLREDQVEALDEMARQGWIDVTPLVRGLAYRKTPLCSVEIDYEAGDPEYGDKRYVACLTAAGAQTIARLRSTPIYIADDFSYVWEPAESSEAYFDPRHV